VFGIRISVSLACAIWLTTSLFWFLWILIGTRREETQIAAIPHIEFSRLKLETELEEIKRVKPVIEKPAPPPSAPTVSASKELSVVAGMDSAALAPSDIDFTSGFGGGSSGGVAPSLSFSAGGDRDAMPQFRIDPDYPPGARERGIEGWVVVGFDVGTEGGTKNISVIDAKPKNIFDHEAIRAVSLWKYNPMVKDGRPTERTGLAVRLVFSLNH